MLELCDFSSLQLEEKANSQDESSMIDCGKITCWLSYETLLCSSSSHCTPSSAPEFIASVHVMAPLGCVSHTNGATGALQAYFNFGSHTRALTQPCCLHVWVAFACRCLLRFQTAQKKKETSNLYLLRYAGGPFVILWWWWGLWGTALMWDEGKSDGSNGNFEFVL